MWVTIVAASLAALERKEGQCHFAKSMAASCRP
jgi:hypothetical protein